MGREVNPGEIGRVLSHCPRIAAAWVFGSVARGEARPNSDLDLAVLLCGEEQPGDARTLLEVSVELERYSPSGRVDIVILGPQGAVLRHRIVSEGLLVLDADRDRRLEFEERTVRDYLDWKPTHDIAMRATFQGLRKRFAALHGEPRR
ncbi:MAG: nucleotidyltransferase domain-containing protein [Myxococcales bacterium]|nr:nucleotidyltransferase domain-containing protein [Myxococcales bacterium]